MIAIGYAVFGVMHTTSSILHRSGYARGRDHSPCSFYPFIMYQPYRDWYSQAYSALDPWKGPFTPIWSYLTHWLVFLFIVVSWMAWETREWMASTPVSALRKLKPYAIVDRRRAGRVCAGTARACILERPALAGSRCPSRHGQVFCCCAQSAGCKTIRFVPDRHGLADHDRCGSGRCGAVILGVRTRSSSSICRHGYCWQSAPVPRSHGHCPPSSDGCRAGGSSGRSP